jgi:steroid delta-isomerase-like uncharacterized protein
MGTEANKATARRYYDDVLNAGNIALLDDLAVPQYEEHDPLPGQGTGRDGLKQRVEWLRSAFRSHFTIEDMVAELDKVVVRWTSRGAQVGAFLGMPATGKSFTISGIDIHRLEDGKLAEHWHVVDQLSQLQQLGMIPQPEGNPS